MIKLQNNLKLNSNQLFAEEEKVEPLHVKAPGLERGQSNRRPGPGNPGGQPDMLA